MRYISTFDLNKILVIQCDTTIYCYCELFHKKTPKKGLIKTREHVPQSALLCVYCRQKSCPYQRLLPSATLLKRFTNGLRGGVCCLCAFTGAKIQCFASPHKSNGTNRPSNGTNRPPNGMNRPYLGTNRLLAFSLLRTFFAEIFFPALQKGLFAGAILAF